METARKPRNIDLFQGGLVEAREYFDMAFDFAKRSNCHSRQYGAVLVIDNIVSAIGCNDINRFICTGCDSGSCFHITELNPISVDEYKKGIMYVTGIEEDFGEHGLKQYLDICSPPKSCLNYVIKNMIGKLYAYDRHGIRLVYKNGKRVYL